MDKPIVMAVDDAQENLDMLEGILSGDYAVVTMTSGYDALDYLRNSSGLPKVVLLDIRMPGIDGYHVLASMRADARLRKIPVIVLTGSSSERRALEAGAVDYVAKPFHSSSIKRRIQNQILLHETMDSLERQVEAHVKKNTEVWDKVLEVMSDIIECRNLESGKHVKRTTELYGVLMNELLDNSEYSDELMALGPDAIIKGVPLHDIGKIGIPDSILIKPGKLTPEEFELMKTHTIIGMQLVEKMMDDLQEEQSKDLIFCKIIALEHHERYDGTGYPHNLEGERISLPARLMAVVDVYDALCNKRVYKAASTHEKAMRYIEGGAGTHFDPVVVSAAYRVQGKFKEIERANSNG